MEMPALAPGLFEFVLLVIDVDRQRHFLLQLYACLLLFDDGADLLPASLDLLVLRENLVLEEVANTLGLCGLARLFLAALAPGLDVVSGLLLVLVAHKPFHRFVVDADQQPPVFLLHVH